MSMKLIIAGSREVSWDQFLEALGQILPEFEDGTTEVVSGGARGVDKFGEEIAMANDLGLTVLKADWKKLGKRAGPVRNEQMGDYADALFAVWDGKSKGTKHMIDYMNKLGKPVQVVIV